jgi:deoxyribodipyrimidine photo-lyase
VPELPVIVWFRLDLRLRDNAALQAALQRRSPVIPVYILDDETEGRWRPGAASRWWLHHSLQVLDASLKERGVRLVLRKGNTAEILAELIKQTKASAVYWNRRYEPAVIARDAALKTALQSEGVEVKSFNSGLLFEPHAVANKQGKPFQVFTPFWRHCLSLTMTPEVEVPLQKSWPAPKAWPESLPFSDLGLLPKLSWADAFSTDWRPGEQGAQQHLKRFFAAPLSAYEEARDLPNQEGTSRLSPHLHFGEIGPRQLWAAARKLSSESGVFPLNAGVQRFLAELGWREFAHHLLYHFPNTPELPLREAFRKFPWAEDPNGAKLHAWQRGLTGYPIVDAGMRQLWSTGWMHNRVRMVVASFLVKHLRLPWTQGAAWFWDTLVDADLANNTLGWQWSAGCGADAAPYFRIFAPVTQGEKFDPQGDYVRRWVPELARLPSRFVHKPWEAPASVLAAAGVTLGKTYPRPIVDHARARAEALTAFKSLGRSGTAPEGE